ncbi:MAG: hypothetical protein M3018_09585 [Actinomycetota bacterium]|nr:hypothetical protein [Actinomycetota bacterium]
MGLFKQMKDMKTMVNAAPDLVRQAQQAGAQAQQYAVAQQYAAQQASAEQQTTVAAQASDSDFEPIAGVSIDRYVEVSKGLAAYGYDPTKAMDVAASLGIDADSWQAASEGWNQRMRANPGVAQRFNTIYRGV